MRDELNERANAGEHRLAGGACCCRCDARIDCDERYAVRIWQSRTMRVPCFYYYCEACAQRLRGDGLRIGDRVDGPGGGVMTERGFYAGD